MKMSTYRIVHGKDNTERTITLDTNGLKEVLDTDSVWVYESIPDCHPVLIEVDMEWNQEDVLSVVKIIQQILCANLEISVPFHELQCIVRQEQGIIFYFPYLCVSHHVERNILIPKICKQVTDVNNKILKEDWEVSVDPENIMLVGFLEREKIHSDKISIVEDKTLMSLQRNLPVVMPKNKKRIAIQNIPKDIFDEKRTLCEILPMVSTLRDKIDVGQAIFDIVDGHDEGRELWSQWRPDVPLDKWQMMTKQGFTIHYVKMWASQDSPDDYTTWYKQDYASLVEHSCTKVAGHKSIAVIIYQMVKHRFRCTDARKSMWYEFVNHHWDHTNSYVSILNTMDTELYNIYKEYLSKLANDYANAPEEQLEKMVENCEKMMKNLEMNPFKTSLLKECNLLFFDASFEDKLDTKNHLLCFTNGVYDLIQDTFRDGIPEDYCARQLDYEYQEYTWDSPDVKIAWSHLEKIYTDRELRDCVLTILGSVLCGGNEQKILPFFIGTGNNGKSSIRQWMMETLGPYCTSLPTTILTKGQAQADQATASLESMNKTRLGFIDEPDSDDTVKVSQIKKITGSDCFYSRALYSEPKQIEATCKLIVIANKPPHIPESESAIWNRIIVIPHNSKFLSKNDNIPNNEEQVFEADERLVSKDYLKTLRQPLMWILIQYFKVYKKNGIKINNSIQQATKKYRAQNDIIEKFIETHIKEGDDGLCARLEAMYTKYRLWKDNNYPKHKTVDVETFKTECCKHLGDINCDNIWDGYEFKI